MRYQVPVSDEESILKPIGDLAKLIQATSTGDMMLLLIALARQGPQINWPIIGFND